MKKMPLKIFILGSIILSFFAMTSGREFDSAAKINKENIIEIHTSGEDMVDMHYNTKEIDVPEKTDIKIILINDSKDPAMVQNVVIVKPEDADSVAMHGLFEGMSNNFVPDEKAVIAASKLVKPGKRTELKFRTPEKGAYMFISTYPGHYLNM